MALLASSLYQSIRLVLILAVKALGNRHRPRHFNCIDYLRFAGRSITTVILYIITVQQDWVRSSLKNTSTVFYATHINNYIIINRVIDRFDYCMFLFFWCQLKITFTFSLFIA